MSTSGYTPAFVVEYLPYLYEPYLPDGIPSPYASDPQMPSGSKDVSHGGNWMAMLADLRIAWEEPLLTTIERRRLLRYTQLGGDHGYINDGTHRRSALGILAEWEKASRAAVQSSVEVASRKIADSMNGLNRGEWNG